MMLTRGFAKMLGSSTAAFIFTILSISMLADWLGRPIQLSLLELSICVFAGKEGLRHIGQGIQQRKDPLA